MRGIMCVLVALSAISFAMNVPQVRAGNACDVTEEPWRNVIGQCTGQLAMIDDVIACEEAATGECRDAVRQWAMAYREAPNAADPKCNGEDPNYMASQRAAEKC